MSSNCIREKLLENAELSLDRAYDIARSLYAAQKNSELYLQQSHRVIPTNVAATSSDHQTEPDHEALATMKNKNACKRSCYFCGGFVYTSRASCPARDAVSHNCSKRGHFAKVCQSAKKTTTISVTCKPSLCTITTACPSGLRHASVPITINGIVGLTALIGSSSSDNFISQNAFKSLRIPAYPSNKKVTLASTSMAPSIPGQCNVTIQVNGRKYQKVRLDILQNLCSDVILGHNFYKQYKNLIFSYGGK